MFKRIFDWFRPKPAQTDTAAAAPYKVETPAAEPAPGQKKPSGKVKMAVAKASKKAAKKKS